MIMFGYNFKFRFKTPGTQYGGKGLCNDLTNPPKVGTQYINKSSKTNQKQELGRSRLTFIVLLKVIPHN
ncbi:hypothetical protein BB561_000310 [Smittium simulii]|uniref:Uncharacterized protein n=1 Tax=Smittium simulii TaxID=133385 RepID=A0A2T9YZP4_9FUNG|nr:hypothetical protein BB561_000322 [Smittium simulii]PVU97787.1 hypothetical protein BB561_000310 [Smittium simulii]